MGISSDRITSPLAADQVMVGETFGDDDLPAVLAFGATAGNRSNGFEAGVGVDGHLRLFIRRWNG